jgi:hypothetical protein
MYKQFLETPGNIEVKNLTGKVFDMLGTSKPLLIYSIYFDVESQTFKIKFNKNDETDCGEISTDNILKLITKSSEQYLYSTFSINVKALPFFDKFNFKDCDKHCLTIQYVNTEDNRIELRNSWGPNTHSPDEEFKIITNDFQERAKRDPTNYDLYEIHGCLFYDVYMFEELFKGLSKNIRDCIIEILRDINPDEAERLYQIYNEKHETKKGRHGGGSKIKNIKRRKTIKRRKRRTIKRRKRRTIKRRTKRRTKRKY